MINTNILYVSFTEWYNKNGPKIIRFENGALRFLHYGAGTKSPRKATINAQFGISPLCSALIDVRTGRAFYDIKAFRYGPVNSYRPLTYFYTLLAPGTSNLS